MGTQTGASVFINKMGNFRGYKRKGTIKYKTFIGLKGGCTQLEFNTWPSMANTRANAQEFGGACTQGKNIYNLLNSVFNMQASRFINRFNKVSVEIIKRGGKILDFDFI
jgi:hypothetical protein